MDQKLGSMQTSIANIGTFTFLVLSLIVIKKVAFMINVVL